MYVANQMEDIRTIIQISRAGEFIETTIPKNSASIGSSYKERSSKRKEGLHFFTHKDWMYSRQPKRIEGTVVDVERLQSGYIYLPASNSRT